MAITLGINAGFITVTPEDAPAESSPNFNNDTIAIKDTSPVGSYRVIELGWWQSRADGSPAKAYDMGIYSHDSGNDRPNALIVAKSTGENSIADSAQWYKYTGLTIELQSNTDYWPAIGIPGGGNNSKFDYGPSAGGRIYAREDNVAPIQDPWGGTTEETRWIAVYAKYEAAGNGGGRIMSSLVGGGGLAGMGGIAGQGGGLGG